MGKLFFIKTFGCAQNVADSERVKTFFFQKGHRETTDWKTADLVIINTCIVRESAENRAYGLINNVHKLNPKAKIIVTGCAAGLAFEDKSGKRLRELKQRLPQVDEFLPIKKISFNIQPIRNKRKAALIPISSGCNNFCSYCIVPYSRGREVSRPMEEILQEIDKVIEQGFKEVVLVGQNVNSYGSELTKSSFVSMGKKRFKSLFPELLSRVAEEPLTKVSFVSSNPWDFSDELIEVIAGHENIDRLLHLPFQSGDDEILKKMNRGYTAKEYLQLVKKIKKKVKKVRFSTDIIIGFPGESEEAFKNTVKICKAVGFEIAYLNKYSPRPGTVAAKLYSDDIPRKEKKRRWLILEKLVNKKEGKTLS
ncbi:MiaB/RimO family radical SAM methylthiotransferase [Patescibacteria group bacterium]|nr:MiaB/RimO family radical SAM methylthiotransferase [Patescibacteria group bacterium]